MSAAQGRSKDDKRKLPFLELNTKNVTEPRIASPVSKKQLAPSPSEHTGFGRFLK